MKQNTTVRADRDRQFLITLIVV